MRVFVYRNLHQKCLSIKALEGPNKGRVIAHVHACTLEQPTFKVSQAGRERVLREKAKNVHAGVVGELTQCDLMALRYSDKLDCIPSLAQKVTTDGKKVSYNPYRAGYFYDEEFNPVQSLPKCLVTTGGAFPLSMN